MRLMGLNGGAGGVRKERAMCMDGSHHLVWPCCAMVSVAFEQFSMGICRQSQSDVSAKRALSIDLNNILCPVQPFLGISCLSFCRIQQRLVQCSNLHRHSLHMRSHHARRPSCADSSLIALPDVSTSILIRTTPCFMYVSSPPKLPHVLYSNQYSYPTPRPTCPPPPHYRLVLYTARAALLRWELLLPVVG